MQPTSPIIQGIPEVVYAKSQPEYMPLPVARSVDKQILLCRWALSDEDRAIVAAGGDLYIGLWTFGGALQPICPEVHSKESARTFAESLGIEVPALAASEVTEIPTSDDPRSTSV